MRVSFCLPEEYVPDESWIKAFEKGTVLPLEEEGKSATSHCWIYQSWALLIGAKVPCYLFHEMPQEDINRLKDHINMLVIKATIPEHDESKDKALKERKKLVYGRIYMIDGVQSFEYSLASFGLPPPVGRMQLAMSDDVGNEDGCAPVKKDLSGKVSRTLSTRTQS